MGQMGFILTKWYVNATFKSKFLSSVSSFILTKWYVNTKLEFEIYDYIIVLY